MAVSIFDYLNRSAVVNSFSFTSNYGFRFAISIKIDNFD